MVPNPIVIPLIFLKCLVSKLHKSLSFLCIFFSFFKLFTWILSVRMHFVFIVFLVLNFPIHTDHNLKYGFSKDYIIFGTGRPNKKICKAHTEIGEAQNKASE